MVIEKVNSQRMLRFMAVAAWCVRLGAPVEYCSARGDGGCETLRAHDTGAPVFLDTGSLGGTTTLDMLKDTGLKELRHMRAHGQGKRSQGVSMGAKFRNFRRKKLEMRWDDGTEEGTYSGIIGAMGRSSTLTYAGHAFLFVDGDTRERVARFVMEAGNNLYVLHPDEGDAETLASASYRDALAEVAFMRTYDDENGTPWLAYYPRPKPILNMWPAEFVGQTHVVGSEAAYHVSPDAKHDGDLALSLQVLSHNPAGPRVFLVREMLSQFECDHIIELGTKVIRQSMVGQGGGFTSKTRTSENGWLKRGSSPILENIYRRFGDVLGVDHDLLRSSANAEELQVVRYLGGQEYAPHHDFGDDGTPQQRFLTLLLYIKVPDRGGATSFPKADGGRGIQVVPARGDAVLFYSMLPDGNADELSLHAGMPVTEGEKWVCNLWVWDPYRGGRGRGSDSR